MTNQEMILQIADNMALLAKSVRHFAENMLIPTPTEEAKEDVPAKAEQPEKTVTLEEVRAVLAAKSAAGKNAEVKSLISKYGADKLSAVDPGCYAALLKDAEVL